MGHRANVRTFPLAEMKPVPTVSDVVAQIFISSDASEPTYPFVSAKRTEVAFGLSALGFDPAAVKIGISNAVHSQLVDAAGSGHELRAFTSNR